MEYSGIYAKDRQEEKETSEARNPFSPLGIAGARRCTFCRQSGLYFQVDDLAFRLSFSGSEHAFYAGAFRLRQ